MYSGCLLLIEHILTSYQSSLIFRSLLGMCVCVFVGLYFADVQYVLPVIAVARIRQQPFFLLSTVLFIFSFITQALKAISVSASTSLKTAWLLKPDLDLKVRQESECKELPAFMCCLFSFICLSCFLKEHTTMIAYLTPTIRSVYNIYRHEWCSAGQILILLRRGCIGRSSLVTLKINTDTIMSANSLWESRCDLFGLFFNGLVFHLAHVMFI